MTAMMSRRLFLMPMPKERLLWCWWYCRPRHPLQHRIIRTFQSPAEYRSWRQNVVDTRLRVDSSQMVRLDLRTRAPYLYSVSPTADRLQLFGAAESSSTDDAPTIIIGSPRSSMLECHYPLADDELLRNSVTDFSNNWSTFRLGKFFETVDALTGDVAYRHCNDNDQTEQLLLDNNKTAGTRSEKVILVTAGHYHSRKFQRTDIRRNLKLRSYVTRVNRSSMEIRTDAIQQPDDKEEEECLLNVCHTIMVALDPTTMQPLSKSGRSIRPLVVSDNGDEAAAAHRLELARQHQEIRKRRSSQAMQLRGPVSLPPTFEEMQSLHKLHHDQAQRAESAAAAPAPTTLTSMMAPRVADYTFHSSTVIFPENRNVHGKLFGGFVMSEAHNLAQYTATFFSKGEPIISLGIDEAIFLQPIGIGDLLTFTARLVHSTANTCRVVVTVEVRDAADRNRLPMHSNRLIFVFGSSHFPTSGSIIPDSYREILMHIDAQRRHAVEGPFSEEVGRILQESSSSKN